MSNARAMMVEDELNARILTLELELERRRNAPTLVELDNQRFEQLNELGGFLNQLKSEAARLQATHRNYAEALGHISTLVPDFVMVPDDMTDLSRAVERRVNLLEARVVEVEMENERLRTWAPANVGVDHGRDPAVTFNVVTTVPAPSEFLSAEDIERARVKMLDQKGEPMTTTIADDAGEDDDGEDVPL